MRRFRTFKIAKSLHPATRWMFEEMIRQRIGMFDMADRTGVNYETLVRWASGKRSPGVRDLWSCYVALGFVLTPVEIND